MADEAVERPSLQELAERWYRPLRDPVTWRALAYAVIGPLVVALQFVAALLVVLGAIPLIVGGIGIPLTVAGFTLIDRMARAERNRARLAGVTIAARWVADGRSWWSKCWARLGDGNRWRQVGYFMSAPVVATLVFLGALLGWVVPMYLLSLPLWGWAVGLSWTAMILLWIVGVVVLGLAPRVSTLMARAGAHYAGWLLGPDPVAAMQERVDTLTENRQEILEAVAVERRRIERNLHDGVQQRLVALGIDLGLAAAKLPDDPDEAQTLVESARDKARSSITELRAIGRGLHPAVLEDRGLDAALSAVVSGSPIPIELRCHIDSSVPDEVEETAYFVVSEAVSNILKHSGARVASIDVTTAEDQLTIAVHDDGVGGADSSSGTGLAGIAARVRGMDGAFAISSPPGGPTLLDVAIPYPSP